MPTGGFYCFFGPFAGIIAMYKAGDRVVYLVRKHSDHPGPRAEAVQPEPHGEGYSYAVKKYWRVLEVLPTGQLAVQTRRGKQRVVQANDPQLRLAHWWEKLLLSSRFPGGGSDAAAPQTPPTAAAG